MSNNLTLKTLASQQINDSAVSGTTIKDALETLEILNASSGDKNYIHNQIAPNNVWTITHNLGKFPSVTISDSTDRIVIGDIHFINNNEIQIFFKGAFSGKAYLN